jgi:hypothetical protein
MHKPSGRLLLDGEAKSDITGSKNYFMLQNMYSAGSKMLETMFDSFEAYAISFGSK